MREQREKEEAAERDQEEGQSEEEAQVAEEHGGLVMQSSISQRSGCQLLHHLGLVR